MTDGAAGSFYRELVAPTRNCATLPNFLACWIIVHRICHSPDYRSHGRYCLFFLCPCCRHYEIYRDFFPIEPAHLPALDQLEEEPTEWNILAPQFHALQMFLLWCCSAYPLVPGTGVPQERFLDHVIQLGRPCQQLPAPFRVS